VLTELAHAPIDFAQGLLFDAAGETTGKVFRYGVEEGGLRLGQ
jgi:hypothetical protein